MCIHHTIAVPSMPMQAQKNTHGMNITMAIMTCVQTIAENLENLMLIRDNLLNDPTDNIIVQMDMTPASPNEAAAAIKYCVDSVSRSLDDLLNVKTKDSNAPTITEVAQTQTIQTEQATQTMIEPLEQPEATPSKAIVSEIVNIEKSLDSLMKVRDTLWCQQDSEYFTAMNPVDVKANEVADSILMYVNKVAQSSSVLLEIQVGLTPNAEGVVEYQDTALRLVAEMIAQNEARKKAIAALP